MHTHIAFMNLHYVTALWIVLRWNSPMANNPYFLIYQDFPVCFHQHILAARQVSTEDAYAKNVFQFNCYWPKTMRNPPTKIL